MALIAAALTDGRSPEGALVQGASKEEMGLLGDQASVPGSPSVGAPPSDPLHPAARAIDLVKTYGRGASLTHALAGITLELQDRRFTAVMGPSGSGKSTLMHCLAGLDVPTSGQVFVRDLEVGQLGDADLTQLRRDRIGFIFQSFNLVPTLTARENITLPLELAGRRADPDWLHELIQRLGIEDQLGQRPSEISGGQQQKVACARALVGRPELIFADEPTGNLDSNAAAEILAFLREAVVELGHTVVMVTHDPNAAAHADRVLFLADGRLVGDLGTPTADAILDQMRRLRR
jgi:putative ABC transport system ATP-binding protein